MAQLAYRCEGDLQHAGAWSGKITVMVTIFGDDADILSIMAEDARGAGLEPCASRSLESLLDSDAGSLGDIVLVDCSALDAAKLAALVRLDERSSRSGAQLVVSTSRETLEDIFGCLETSRPILLLHPTRAERLVALAEALTRMSGHRVREMDEQDRVTLLRLTQEVGRLAEKLDRFSSIPSTLVENGRLSSPSLTYRPADRDTAENAALRRSRPPLPDPRLVREILRQRRMRDEFFDTELFADPAWDILLDLTIARAEHRRVSVTLLCIAAAVPNTTALRWIVQMVDSGLLVREQDGEDRRRAFIALSDHAAEAMARYFEKLGKGALAAI